MVYSVDDLAWVFWFVVLVLGCLLCRFGLGLRVSWLVLVGLLWFVVALGVLWCASGWLRRVVFMLGWQDGVATVGVLFR